MTQPDGTSGRGFTPDSGIAEARSGSRAAPGTMRRPRPRLSPAPVGRRRRASGTRRRRAAPSSMRERAGVGVSEVGPEDRGGEDEQSQRRRRARPAPGAAARSSPGGRAVRHQPGRLARGWTIPPYGWPVVPADGAESDSPEPTRIGASARVTHVWAPAGGMRRPATPMSAGTAVRASAVVSRTTTTPPSAMDASNGSANAARPASAAATASPEIATARPARAMAVPHARSVHRRRPQAPRGSGRRSAARSRRRGRGRAA